MLIERVKRGSELNSSTLDNASVGQVASKIVSPVIDERRHAEYFDVINSSLSINSKEELLEWAKDDLQYIFPHGMLICGIGLIKNQTIQMQQLLTSNFSPEYIQILHQTGGVGNSPVFKQWLKTRKPVLFELAAQHTQTTWLDDFKQHGLVNMAAHGQCDLSSKATSYFSFSRIPAKLDSRHSNLLHMLVPHMHTALIRAFADLNKVTRKTKPALPELTVREQEILKWLSRGKTNWEVAQALCLSEHTVKNHVQRILVKLNVNTRTQAVAKVLERSNMHNMAVYSG